ncbi:MAG TPA: hypothetical protein VJ201_04810, partial [Candidatus Babeliales bacterium]|nr:hypothetical protein [Candidatus Babeliales bacterium]
TNMMRSDPIGWLLWYFQGSKKVVVGECWEPMVWQLDWLCEALENSFVDPKTQTIVHTSWIPKDALKNYKKLKDVWRASGLKSHYKLAAFYLDYLNDFAMEGVLYQDLQKVQLYKQSFDQALSFVKGSREYEVLYRDVGNTIKELITILRKKLSSDAEKIFLVEEY